MREYGMARRWRVAAMSGLIVAAMLLFSGITQSAEVIRIKAEHDEQVNSLTDLLVKEMAQEIEQKTNGRVRITVHPTGSLSGGDIKTMVQNAQSGAVELSFIATSVYTSWDPRIGVFSLPFLNGSIDDLERLARYSPLARRLFADQIQRNLMVVDSWSRTLRQIVNNKREIKTPDDMKGLRFRVPEIKLWADAFRAMGARPIPMPFSEIPTALQLGTVDGAERPFEFLVTEKWWEMAKYITVANYTGDVLMVAFNLKFWNQLPKDVQEVLIETIKTYGNKKFAGEKEIEGKVVQVVQDHGMKVTRLSPDQLVLFQKAMDPVWKENSRAIGQELIEEAVGFLKEGRPR